jgi:hypothetical protein
MTPARGGALGSVLGDMTPTVRAVLGLAGVTESIPGS